MQVSSFLQANSKHGNPFVFCLTSRGFYSEINGLLNAILFGLITKRRLYVDQSEFADGHLAWSDLYTSPLPWSTGKSRSEVEPSWIIEGVQSAGFAAIRSQVIKWHEQRQVVLLEGDGSSASIFAVKRHLARQFCQPLIKAKMSESWPAPYAALHVRRGDKVNGYTYRGNLIIEGESTPLLDYLSIVKSKAPHVRALFVMTDDYRVIEDLRRIDPGYDIITFCQEGETGYVQDQFDMLASQSKTMAVRRLISEVELACDSEVFVGCYLSNVSRYIALTHKNSEQCYSVDRQKCWHPG